MKQITHLDLFSGLGGFALAFLQADSKLFKTLAFCENNAFCQKLLKQNFPSVKIFEDVKTLSLKSEVDIISAGFPCQDLSVAGKKAGLEGERSGLFNEVLRIAKETQAKFILLENSAELICKDSYRREFIKRLQKCGYDCGWELLCAKSFGYPHKRKRAYVLAWKQTLASDSSSIGRFLHEKFQFFYSNEGAPTLSKTLISLCCEYNERERTRNYELDYADIRGTYGISQKLEQIKALGNAILPVIAKLYALSLKEFFVNFKGAKYAN